MSEKLCPRGRRRTILARARRRRWIGNIKQIWFMGAPRNVFETLRFLADTYRRNEAVIELAAEGLRRSRGVFPKQQYGEPS